jgi:excisionase family DNA binding protein
MEKKSLDDIFELMGTENPVEVIPNSRNTSINWKSTKQIAEILGISRDKVLEWIRSGVFQSGVHYRNISFDKNRPTYRFDLEKINQLFEG